MKKLLKNKFTILAVAVVFALAIGVLVGGFASSSKAGGEGTGQSIVVGNGGTLNIYNSIKEAVEGLLGGTTNFDDLEVDSITIIKSVDGHVGQADFSMTATGTPTAVYTNDTGTDMMCDGGSGFIYANATAPAPSLRFSLATSTSATGFSTINRIIASTTVATSSTSVLPYTSNISPFVLATGSSIIGIFDDFNWATASSTFYSNWDVETAIHCWLLGQ